MSEAAAAAMPTRTAPLTKLFPDGAPEETEDETAQRISALKERSVQPVKRQYICSAPPKEAGSQRGQNKKRPIEKMEPKTEEMRTDPPGVQDESGRIPFAAMLSLRKRERAFLTPRADPVDHAEAAKRNVVDPIDLEPCVKERKPVSFVGKIYVAPLTTVGNLPFRRILTKHGADITCGEMALAQSLIDGQSSEWALLRRHKEEKCFGVQISAAHGDQMGRVSELISEHCDVDFVDLNMGCPIELVCKKGAGAALQKRRKKVQEIVFSGLRQLDCPLTIKMRTGWDETPKLAHTMAGYIQHWAHQHGVHSVPCVYVHGRSRTARYTKAANWSYINTVAKCQDDAIPPLPIIGNGDVFSWRDYKEKRAKAPATCDCAMLARGALIKPWLPTELKEKRDWDISSSERLDILRDFCKYGLEHWGSDSRGVARTRRFLLEWLSFLHRYTPVGLLEVLPQRIGERPPFFVGRDDLETLMASHDSRDWLKISELLLGKADDSAFTFVPKHRSNGYADAAPGPAANDWG